MEIPLAIALGNPIPRVGDKINIDGDTAVTVIAVYPNEVLDNVMGDNPDNYEHFIVTVVL